MKQGNTLLVLASVGQLRCSGPAQDGAGCWRRGRGEDGEVEGAGGRSRADIGDSAQVPMCCAPGDAQFASGEWPAADVLTILYRALAV